MDDKLANERFKVLYKRAFEQHIFDQKQKFEKFQQVEVESEKHNNKLNNNNNKLGGGMRKLFAFINDDDDDDLEDERGEREFLDESLSGFQGMQGWLTNDGVESLDVILLFLFSFLISFLYFDFFYLFFLLIKIIFTFFMNYDYYYYY